MTFKNLSPEMNYFASAVQRKIESHNEAKGESWRNKSIGWLIDRLSDEHRVLVREYINGTSKGMANECLDVAAFAMFIYILSMDEEKDDF